MTIPLNCTIINLNKQPPAIIQTQITQCSQNFQFLPLLTLHYSKLPQLILFLLTLILIPIIFLNIKHIAENFLAKAISQLIHKYRISN